MREDCARRFKSCREKKRRPVNGVETQDVFADQMHGRPEFLKTDDALSLLVAEADGRDVISQSVEPDVDRMRRIIRHRDAPTHRTLLPTDRQILQAAAHEADDFIAPRVRSNELQLAS